MKVRELNFLNGLSEIFNALLKSKEEGTSIGIKSSSLEGGTIITAVEDIIYDEGNTIIVFKRYDSSGYILPSHRINLSDIQAVYPFATPFVNPYIQSFDKDKSWFF